MARTGSLGAGTISPFGGGGVDFGVFDIANTKSVSAQETASNEWAVARAQYEAGQLTDEQYMAAQQAYYAALDPSTQGYATGAYQIAQTQYSIGRDQIAQQVQMGDLPPSALVDFDRNALAQVQPGSAEYRQRYDRLMSSEGMVFQADEAQVQRDYSKGYLTSQQVQDWYKGQAETYAENYNVSQDISDKIYQMQGRIDGEADQKLADAFNHGQVTIGQVIAYVAKVQASDPNSQRARDLLDYADQAKGQAVETSLTYRYGLTREYQQLSAYVASNSSSTTQYSTSHQTRTYLDANGNWKTVTTATTKAVKPSASEQAAAQKRAIEVAAAKERMKAIEAEVGMLPGGWVTADDVIAQLRQQQSKMKVGTPQWYAIQKNIDGYQSDKAQMELIAEQGIRVTFPKVGSELVRDLTVSGLERAHGWSKELQAKAAPYINKITAYQAELDAGTADEARSAILQAAIAKNYGYLTSVANKAGVAPPAPASFRAASGGGAPTSTTGGTTGGGGGKVAVGPGATGAGTAAAGQGPFNVVLGTQFYQQTKGAVVAGPYNAASVKTSPAGWPTGMSPTAFDELYDHAVAAVKGGKATFTYGGVSYAIPTDPKARLDFMAAVDAKNVALRAEQYRAQASKPGASQSSVDTKARAYYNAVAASETNKLYILNSPTPGALKDSSGKTIKITEYPVNPANSLGFAQDIFDTAELYVKDQYVQAQRYMDAGDYTSAAKCIGLANDRITSSSSAILRWTGKAQAYIDQTVQQGAGEGVQVKVPPEIQSVLTKLSDPGALWTAVVKPADKMATTLFGTFDARTGQQTSKGILKVIDGQPILVPTPNGMGFEAALEDGVVRVVTPDGSITTTKGAVIGKSLDGTLLPGGKNAVTVKVKTLNGYVDALAQYTVGPSMFVANVGGAPVQLQSKIININGEVWFENPLQPGQWLPDAKGRMVNVSVGPNVRAITIQTGAGMEGVTAGTQALAFDVGGTNYMLVPDPASGTYNLWRESLDGTPQLLGPAAGATGRVAQDIAGVISNGGIRLDTGSLSSDQRSYLNLSTVSPIGAWLNTNPNSVNAFLHPKVVSPSVLAFDTGSERVGIATAYTAATAAAAAIYAGDRTEGRNAYATQPLSPSLMAGGAMVGTGLLGPQYSSGPTYTPSPSYGEGSAVTAKPLTAPNYLAASYQQPTGAAYKPTTYGEGSAVTAKPLTVTKPPTTTTYKPAPAPSYGEGSAITAKPLTAPKPTPTPTKAVAPPPRPNQGAPGSRGK